MRDCWTRNWRSIHFDFFSANKHWEFGGTWESPGGGGKNHSRHIGFWSTQLSLSTAATRMTALGPEPRERGGDVRIETRLITAGWFMWSGESTSHHIHKETTLWWANKVLDKYIRKGGHLSGPGGTPSSWTSVVRSGQWQ